MDKNTGSVAKQHIEGVNITGKLRQSSDTSSTEQKIKDATAKSVDQGIYGQQEKLQMGSYKASGRWAILALLIIVLAFFIYKSLS